MNKEIYRKIDLIGILLEDFKSQPLQRKNKSEGEFIQTIFSITNDLKSCVMSKSEKRNIIFTKKSETISKSIFNKNDYSFSLVNDKKTLKNYQIEDLISSVKHLKLENEKKKKEKDIILKRLSTLKNEIDNEFDDDGIDFLRSIKKRQRRITFGTPVKKAIEIVKKKLDSRKTSFSIYKANKKKHLDKKFDLINENKKIQKKDLKKKYNKISSKKKEFLTNEISIETSIFDQRDYNYLEINKKKNKSLHRNKEFKTIHKYFRTMYMKEKSSSWSNKKNKEINKKWSQ